MMFADIYCFLQGCCVGEGTMSNLSKSGLDVQSLVSIPGETDTESVIAADDVHVEEKIQDTKSTVKRATKTCNLFCNIPAKRVEK